MPCSGYMPSPFILCSPLDPCPLPLFNAWFLLPRPPTGGTAPSGRIQLERHHSWGHPKPPGVSCSTRWVAVALLPPSWCSSPCRGPVRLPPQHGWLMRVYQPRQLRGRCGQGQGRSVAVFESPELRIWRLGSEVQLCCLQGCLGRLTSSLGASASSLRTQGEDWMVSGAWWV